MLRIVLSGTSSYTDQPGLNIEMVMIIGYGGDDGDDGEMVMIMTVMMVIMMMVVMVRW